MVIPKWNSSRDSATPISEGTINTVMLSPLLKLLGFFDPPYKVQGEYFVWLTIAAGSELDDDGEPIVLRGRIDDLVLQNRLWVILVEAKPYHEPVGFSMGVAPNLGLYDG
jgi:hypothetical protein